MKYLLGIIFLTITLTAQAKEPQDESQLDEHGSYTNVDGKQIHKPAHDK